MDCGVFGQCFPRQSMMHSPTGGDTLDRRAGFRFSGFDSQTKIPDETITVPLAAPIATYGMTFRRAPSHPQTRYWCQVDKVEVGSDAEVAGVASGAVLVEFDLVNLRNVHYDDVLSRLKQAQSLSSGDVSLIFSQPASTNGRKPLVIPHPSSGPQWPADTTAMMDASDGRPRTNSTMTQFWMSDQHAKCCVACDELFTFCRRRHHCRSCGQIFCSTCCHRLPLSFKPRDASMHWLRNQLVCHKCHRQLKEGLLHHAAPVSASTSKATFHRNLPTLPQPHQRQVSSTSMLPPPTPKLGDAPATAPALSSSLSETVAEPNQFLQDINPALFAMFPKAHMVPPAPVKAPSAAVLHPLFPHYTPTAKAAHPTLRRCGSDPDLLHPTHRHVRFRGLFADGDSSVDLDDVHYTHRPRGINPTAGSYSRSLTAPMPTCQRPSSSYPAMDSMARFVKDGNYQLSKACANASSVPAIQAAAAANRVRMADHATAFILDKLGSMIEGTNLPGLTIADQCAYVDILLSLSSHASSAVEDGVAGCRIKCFPGGAPSDSFVVPGVLLRKRMARKRMRPSVDNPRVLVIASALDYHKDKESFSPLEHVAGLETEYMRIAAEKIKRLRPDVVVFQKHVHRVAEECLASNDIVVVKNIKAEDLTRIARVTGAAVLTAFDHVDKMSSDAILGTCKRFRVWTPDPPEPPSSSSSTRMSRKQCVVFETDSPSLGVTLGLRGAKSKAVLVALRDIVVQTVHLGYHLRLQRSLWSAWGISPPSQLPPTPSASFDSMYLALRESSPSLRSYRALQQLKCVACKAADVKALSTRRRSSGSAHHLLQMNSSIQGCTCPSGLARPLCRTQLVVSTCWSRLDNSAPSVAEWNVLNFYTADGDCSVGHFLHKYCFESAAPVFRTAFKTHELSFTHDMARVHVRVMGQPTRKKKNAGDALVDMVNFAKNAVQNSATTPITWVSGPHDDSAPSYVDMTADMLAYSFGKFVEDLIYMRPLPFDAAIAPQLDKVSTDQCVRYFAQADVVVAVAVERIDPVVTVTLKPTLWQDPYRSSDVEFEDLVLLAEEVRGLTLQKIDEALGDLSVMHQTKQLQTRELPKSMDKLATLRGSVRFWCLSFTQKVRESPPVDVFARHALFREIYEHAARMCVELRDSTSTQSTFKQGSEVDTNNALPTWWFKQMAVEEQGKSSPPVAPSASDVSGQSPSTLSLSGLVLDDHSINRTSVDSTASVADFVQRVNKGEYSPPDQGGGFSAVVSAGITFFDSGVDLNDAMSSQSNSLTYSESQSWNRTLVVGSDIPKLGAIKSTSTSASTSHFLELPASMLSWHPSLPVGVDDVVVLVNPTQPTSVVAYSLCSVEYTSQLKDWFGLPTATSDMSRPHLLTMLKSDRRSNIEHLFVDDNEFQSATKFGCKSFYASQFHALRQLVEYDERRFVESLCTCETWQVSGGKSGAGFMKTKDERFLAKVVPSNHVQMFLNLAPKYFEYLAKAIEDGAPTMLSKIVGVYRISIGDTNMNLLVMENLVYGRQVDVLFDLKGKMEGRSAPDEGGGGGAVLWDRNFVKMCQGIPMPMQESAMEVLKTAMINDSNFLASVDVVDYSMLLGYDRQKQEIVVSIIDYIVKYDLMKRLEHHGKRLLQDEGEITVLNPKQYTKRFQTAMTKYFTPIPSRYTAILQRHDDDLSRQL